jgi:hypothetical protein
VEHSVAPVVGVVHDKFQPWRVAKLDRLANLALDFPGGFPDGAERLVLALLIADGGDKNRGGVEVVRDADLADADEAKLDRELAPEDFVEFPLEKLSHTHVAQIGHD